MTKIAWRSPSNLAIIKYWGKYGVQMPQNPSVSLTLSNAFTEMTLNYQPKKQAVSQIEFAFEGKPNEPFRLKIAHYLTSLHDTLPFLKDFDLQLASHNSFPHSAGIASSASSMSALALCLTTMERDLGVSIGKKKAEPHFFRRASMFARLGSGSACRSVYPVAAVWGKCKEVYGSSDKFAVPYQEEIHPIFHTFRDDILIVSKREKSISSRAGHALMENNVYAKGRYTQARERLKVVLKAMEAGDLEKFGEILEDEALTLHALMMTSSPSFTLLHPNTLKIIELVRTWRKVMQLPLYFSLDAGPNPHLLYPDSIAPQVHEFVQKELLQYCENKQYIRDKVGMGAIRCDD
ncbi:MAG: diphosphomevalonate decarboxylase [Bacteroidota bacterium]|jgi:diphosphomevalonate decarboxylase